MTESEWKMLFMTIRNDISSFHCISIGFSHPIHLLLKTNLAHAWHKQKWNNEQLNLRQEETIRGNRKLKKKKKNCESINLKHEEN